ncbi:MAG TPA: hypothetical protein ENK23_02960 [Sorangium sp.]|nr:hypothetical protein [Sorangium sp.]
MAKTPAKKSSPTKSSAGVKPAKRSQRGSASKRGRASKGGSSSQRGTASVPVLQPVSKRARIDPTRPPTDSQGKRKYGLRGAAPWVARHAAKRAEEMRRRNAEPAPEGSARATLRTPEHAEELKRQIMLLHQRVGEIEAMRKQLDSTFFEVGMVLAEIQQQELFVAKGFSTFESFVDREVDLPRGLALKLLRIAHTFQRDAAYDFGLDRVVAALAALDGAIVSQPTSRPTRSSHGIRWDD